MFQFEIDGREGRCRCRKETCNFFFNKINQSSRLQWSSYNIFWQSEILNATARIQKGKKE